MNRTNMNRTKTWGCVLAAGGAGTIGLVWLELLLQQAAPGLALTIAPSAALALAFAGALCCHLGLSLAQAARPAPARVKAELARRAGPWGPRPPLA